MSAEPSNAEIQEQLDRIEDTLDEFRDIVLATAGQLKGALDSPMLKGMASMFGTKF